MSEKNSRARLLHDLRAPLARATTYSKLLAEASPEESSELLLALQKSLSDMDELLRETESEKG